jgi:hypothetical protein
MLLRGYCSCRQEITVYTTPKTGTARYIFADRLPWNLVSLGLLQRPCSLSRTLSGQRYGAYPIFIMRAQVDCGVCQDECIEQGRMSLRLLCRSPRAPRLL